MSVINNKNHQTFVNDGRFELNPASGQQLPFPVNKDLIDAQSLNYLFLLFPSFLLPHHDAEHVKTLSALIVKNDQNESVCLMFFR